MPAPTAYTEEALGEFMLTVLGVVGQVLQYTSASFGEEVSDTLLAYGVADIAQATDIKKLRALAKVAAWQKANDDLVAFYDYQADGGKFDRSQMQAMAEKALASALAGALAYDPNYQVQVTREKPVNDPYRYIPDEERTI
jgi:hypothetical protein